jgi:hypothetical protein
LFTHSQPEEFQQVHDEQVAHSKKTHEEAVALAKAKLEKAVVAWLVSPPNLSTSCYQDHTSLLIMRMLVVRMVLAQPLPFLFLVGFRCILELFLCKESVPVQ